MAEASGTDERYAREWLEQQAVTGLLNVADPTAAPRERRYSPVDGVTEVLCDGTSLDFLAPLARQLAAAGRQLPALATAYRTGGGVPWSQFGADMRESEADLNRPGFERLLVDDWLGALPDVRSRLAGAQAARVADIGCGAGWSAIALARGFPTIVVDGVELDAESVELARRNVADAGIADRIRMHCADIATMRTDLRYDLVTVLECLHDLPFPVESLAAMRALAGAGGTVLVADMKVADAFAAPGDDVERLMYGFSLFVCLADSKSTPGSAATGTVLRRPMVERWAREAGYGRCSTLSVSHDLWRFYRLDP
ncbi:methyltransferase domain-containing protein [Tomitella gaofuii]|uniref:methyltransferase domain-containing protein n=1 Tax=Tomitella gaofuii TaxID=2760083 RepID=UPI0015F7978E|nr:methyltransferase domain-containing protein [Tomitella gaofuii]